MDVNSLEWILISCIFFATGFRSLLHPTSEALTRCAGRQLWLEVLGTRKGLCCLIDSYGVLMGPPDVEQPRLAQAGAGCDGPANRPPAGLALRSRALHRQYRLSHRSCKTFMLLMSINIPHPGRSAPRSTKTLFPHLTWIMANDVSFLLALLDHVLVQVICSYGLFRRVHIDLFILREMEQQPFVLVTENGIYYRQFACCSLPFFPSRQIYWINSWAHSNSLKLGLISFASAVVWEEGQHRPDYQELDNLLYWKPAGLNVCH